MKEGQLVVVLDTSSYGKSKYDGQVVRVVGIIEPNKDEKYSSFKYRCASSSGEVVELFEYQLKTMHQIYESLISISKQIKNLEVEEKKLEGIVSSFKILEELN